MQRVYSLQKRFFDNQKLQGCKNNHNYLLMQFGKNDFSTKLRSFTKEKDLNLLVKIKKTIVDNVFTIFTN